MRTRYRTNQKVGSLEFARADEINKMDALNALSSMITPGIIVSFDNNNVMSDNWKTIIKGETILQIKAGKAVILNSVGELVAVELPADVEYSLTGFSLGTNYIYLKHKAITYEEGTITLHDGNTTVDGVGTKFTKVLAANRRIIVGSNVYTVESVVTDTECYLTDNFVEAGSAIAGERYSVGGWFLGTPPVGLSDNTIYEYNEVEIVPSATTISDTGYYLLATVIVGLDPMEAIEFQTTNDMRHLSLFRLVQANGKLAKIKVDTVIGSATEIEVYPGQTLNFPNSHSADFSTVLVTFPNPGIGKPSAIGIKYTGKTNNKLTGVTWDTSYPLSPPPFLSANTGNVFTATTFTTDGGVVRVAGVNLKYIKNLTTVDNPLIPGAVSSYFALDGNLQVESPGQIVIGGSALYHIIRLQGVRNNYDFYEIDYGNATTPGNFVIKRNGGVLLTINGTTGEVTFEGTVNASDQKVDCYNLTPAKIDMKGLNTKPTSATDPGNTGDIRFCDDGIYFCVASNTWKKATLATF